MGQISETWDLSIAGRQAYSKALSQLQMKLRRPGIRADDDLIASVHVLSIYEVSIRGLETRRE